MRSLSTPHIQLGLAEGPCLVAHGSVVVQTVAMAKTTQETENVCRWNWDKATGNL
jgi:hypothetical protein